MKISQEFAFNSSAVFPRRRPRFKSTKLSKNLLELLNNKCNIQENCDLRNDKNENIMERICALFSSTVEQSLLNNNSYVTLRRDVEVFVTSPFPSKPFISSWVVRVFRRVSLQLSADVVATRLKVGAIASSWLTSLFCFAFMTAHPISRLL